MNSVVYKARWRTAKVVGVIAAAALLVPAGFAPAATAAPGDPFTPSVDLAFRDHEANGIDRIDSIMSQLTFDEMVGGGTPARLGFASIVGGGGGGGECLHGPNGAGSIAWPTPLGFSQTWDPALFYAIGEEIADEKTAGSTMGGSCLGPVLDIYRDPRYGRAYETPGEDPTFIGIYGTQLTTGMSKRTDDGYFRFTPTLKHPLGYNNEINRLWTNTSFSQQAARDYLFPSWKETLSNGGPKSFMNSYPLINGKPMSVSPYQYEMLHSWTPDYPTTGHYEFSTVNDYGSGSSMWVHSQRYFDDTVMGRAFGASQGSVNNQMSWSFRSWGDANGSIYDAYARGMIDEQGISDLARRRVAANLATGSLDQLEVRNPWASSGAGKTLAATATANRDKALLASQEQIVLLKNDGILPLSGAATTKAVLLGDQAETISKDHYNPTATYNVTIQDAMYNKLGVANVSYNRAVDTVAIKANNGAYLRATANTRQTPNVGTGTSIRATGAPAGAAVSMADTALLFEFHDYGEFTHLLRAKIDDAAVQVPQRTVATNGLQLINNTTMPGWRNPVSGSTYTVFQEFRIVPTTQGHFGIFNSIAGNGGNNGYSMSSMAYDVDDEDCNNGSYMFLNADNTIRADISLGKVGPFRAERHVDGASILTSPYDTNPDDRAIDSLPAAGQFDFETVQSSMAAIDSALAAVPADAPVIFVVGQDSWSVAREAVDLQRTGLSAQQQRSIDYITNTLGRDIILVVKAATAMPIHESEQNNPHIKAILTIGHSGQEEGSAIVSALFDDGYTVPVTGFRPINNRGYSGGSTYTSYPGWLPAGSRTVPAYAPSGRLTTTWYKQISDMIGASEDHAPQSYRFPDYNEVTNDNLSNMNGAIPTGILTYDVVKGERTHMYFKGTPLYGFGHGLTYTQFHYDQFAVSPVVNGKFTVSGRVTNAGTKKSDEVVEIYSKFTGTPSRIVQPVNRLLTFDRIRDIAPGQTVPFSFEIDAKLRLGVWDVEAQDHIIEPGTYQVNASASAVAAPYASATLTVTTANGGKAAMARNLERKVSAETMDDYSNVGGRVDDVEFTSKSQDYDSPTVVQFRKDGAWIAFKNVTVSGNVARLSMNVGSDRTSAINVYALPVGTNPSALATATPVGAALVVTDTRPVAGLPAGIGQGPVSLPNVSFPFPGTPNGQNILDNTGQPYKNGYIKPEYSTVVKALPLAAGSYDIYIKADKRGPRVDWFKLSSATLDTTRSIEIDNLYFQDSIRTKFGTLQLRSQLTPDTSTSPTFWQVGDEDGLSTGLATIDGKGLLKATGAGNGKVYVTATSGGVSTTKEILVTNQFDSNRVTISGAQKTIDFISLRTGTGWGSGSVINAWQGTSVQAAVAREQFSENAAQYHQGATYLTIPVAELIWAVTAPDGSPTNLATISATGTVTATGVDDGDVLVTAALRNNPDIVGKRIIRMQNQGVKDGTKMIQAIYDTTAAAGTSTYASLGNQIGMYRSMAANTNYTYKKVDFAAKTKRIEARIANNVAGVGNVNIEVWLDAYGTAAGGTLVGTLTGQTTNAIAQYTTIGSDLNQEISGLHDVILRSSNAMRLNWFQFTGGLVNYRDLLEVLVGLYAQFLDRADEYTAASFATFKSAWEHGRDTLALTPPASIAQINAAIAGLQAGFNGLVPGVMTAHLIQLIGLAQAIVDDPASWVTSSIAGLQGAIDDAWAVINDPAITDAKVKAAFDALQEAIAKAVARGNTAALQALIEFADGLTAADWTPGTWAGLTAPLANAKAVVALAEPSVDQIENATETLKTALAALQAAPNKGPLATAIATADAIMADIDLYQPASVAGLLGALATAKVVYANVNATTLEVQAAQSALVTQIALARLKAPTAPLSAAIASALAVSQSTLTVESAKMLTAAIAQAKTVVLNPNASIADAVRAEAALKAAMSSLVKAKATQTVLKLAKPKLVGKVKAGLKVKAVVKSKTAGAKLSYSWCLNGKAIRGAVKATYKVKAKDAGKKLTVKVTLKSADGKSLSKVSKAKKAK